MKQHLNFYRLECHFPHVVEVPYLVLKRGRLTWKHYLFNLDELYMIFLRYLSTPLRQYEIAIEFGRTPQEVSKGILWFHKKLARVSKRYLQVCVTSIIAETNLSTRPHFPHQHHSQNQNCYYTSALSP